MPLNGLQQLGCPKSKPYTAVRKLQGGLKNEVNSFSVASNEAENNINKQMNC